jgi:NADH-quinone oxidoreductase subunit G
MIKAKVNGIDIEVPAGTSILDAARKVNVEIPTLCHNENLTPWAACGICVVKVEKSAKMLRACCTPIEEGMSVITHDPEIVSIRRTVIELILSTHPDDCLKCPRNQSCELQTLAADFGVREAPYKKILKDIPKDESNGSIVVDAEKCVSCGRCVKVCQEMQNVWAIEFLGRGLKTRIAPAADVKLADSPCIRCGQCSAHCPVGAIYEKDQTREVWARLQDPAVHSVAQIAPAVRVALGEAFGMQPGELSTGKIYAALRRLGFETVFDTNFAADLTIMEEGTELVKRLTEGGQIPLITSCCPAWVDYMEKYYPDMIPNFSTAKSPQQMMGAMVKTYWAKKAGVDQAKIFHASIMPCTAKKYETGRSKDMWSSGAQDVDMSITTRELARLIKQAGIDFAKLPEEKADSPLGPYTGAGVIFGATGGVMEAAVRSAYFLITKRNMPEINFMPVRGIEGIKEAEVEVAGKKLRIAVAHQMGNIAQVLDKVRAARDAKEEPPYHFIEVMACRGGCIGGGGQPYGCTDEIRAKRMAGIYKDDTQSSYRCSHENPYIQQVYEEFLEKPGSHKAHELLHTHYEKRELYNK